MPSTSSARPRRLTVRARLALTYALLVTLAGVTLMAVVAVYFGVVPNYTFGGATETLPTGSGPLTIEVSSPGDDSSLIMPTGIAVTIGSRSDMLRMLLLVSGVVVVLLAALGAWVGWILAGRMLRPLQEVNAAARRAADGHLDHRIGLRGPRDEISDLADTFDEMLGEIEQSVDAHRRFAANASHELRTPLATSKLILDVALASPQTGAREVLTRLRETNERSIATVESLLDLAEIEAVPPAYEPIDLGPLLRDVLRECADEAVAAGVEMSVEVSVEGAPETVDAAPVLIRQLATNLTLNAIRHNIPGGRVRVGTVRRGDYAGLRISNTGNTMSAEEASRLVEPFHRHRGRTSPAAARGRGLGLSIVQAIVHTHRGLLEIVPDPDGGLSVTVLLPRTHDQPVEADAGAASGADAGAASGAAGAGAASGAAGASGSPAPSGPLGR